VPIGRADRARCASNVESCRRCSRSAIFHFARTMAVETPVRTLHFSPIRSIDTRAIARRAKTTG
jgi:hypothetical protein